MGMSRYPGGPGLDLAAGAACRLADGVVESGIAAMVRPYLRGQPRSWQQSAGNTYVYVNTSGVSESLTRTDMKLELLGSVSLTNSNVVHL